jgi:type II secretory pathway pseudopilin PulG
MKRFVGKDWIPAFAGMTKILKKQKNKGFTLIEIIILIVMAGILLPVIIVPFVTGVKSSGKPEMATKAMYLAHQRMEELMKFNYSKTPELDPTPGFPGFTPFSTGDPNYPGEYQIVYANSSDFSPSVTVVNYKRILVRVKDPQNDTYEIYSVVTRFP